MKSRMLTLVALCCLASSGMGEMTSSILVKGKSYRQTVDGQTSAVRGEWEPLKQPCPLSPGKAVRLAADTLKARLPEIEFIEVSTISLNRFPEEKPVHKPRWYYVVNLYLHPKAESFWENEDLSTSREKGERDYATVFVSLDGSVPDIRNGEGG